MNFGGFKETNLCITFTYFEALRQRNSISGIPITWYGGSRSIIQAGAADTLERMARGGWFIMNPAQTGLLL